MPSHFKFAVLLGVTIAHDIYVQIQARQTALLYLESVKDYEETEEHLSAQIAYLIDLLEKHDVPISEFDLLAFNFHVQ